MEFNKENLSFIIPYLKFTYKMIGLNDYTMI